MELQFVSEQHKVGPVHFSSLFKNSLLEIYPETTVKRDKTVLIITVNDIDRVLKTIKDHGGKILENVNASLKSSRAIIEDPDGRIIQIIEV